MLNKIVVQGRIVHTPELRKTGSGTAVLNLDLACGRNRKDANGEYPTDFFKVVIWGKSAEFGASRLNKGDQIVVSGRMESQKYTDKQGNNRISWEIQADEFDFFGKRNNDSSSVNTTSDPTPDFAEPDTSEDVPF